MVAAKGVPNARYGSHNGRFFSEKYSLWVRITLGSRNQPGEPSSINLDVRCVPFAPNAPEGMTLAVIFELDSRVFFPHIKGKNAAFSISSNTAAASRACFLRSSEDVARSAAVSMVSSLSAMPPATAKRTEID